jgi:hypothetical protein
MPTSQGSVNQGTDDTIFGVRAPELVLESPRVRVRPWWLKRTRCMFTVRYEVYLRNLLFSLVIIFKGFNVCG